MDLNDESQNLNKRWVQPDKPRDMQSLPDEGWGNRLSTSPRERSGAL